MCCTQTFDGQSRLTEIRYPSMSFASGKPGNTAFEMSPSAALSIAIASECPSPNPISKVIIFTVWVKSGVLFCVNPRLKIGLFRADLTRKRSRRQLKFRAVAESGPTCPLCLFRRLQFAFEPPYRPVGFERIETVAIKALVRRPCLTGGSQHQGQISPALWASRLLHSLSHDQHLSRYGGFVHSK